MRHILTSRGLKPWAIFSLTAIFTIATAASAALALRDAGRPAYGRPAGHSIGAGVVDDATAGFAIDEVRATAFGTAVLVGIEVATPVEPGAAPALNVEDAHVDGFGIRSIAYSVSRDRRRVLFALEGDPLPEGTKRVGVVIDRFAIIPPDGDGVPQLGPWRGSTAVALAARPQARAATPTSPGEWTIETGDGWSYIIDEVRADDTSTEIRYHVEGSTGGLVGIPPATPLPGSALVMVPEGSQRGSVLVERHPGTTTIVVQFGQAVRGVAEPAATAFTRQSSDWGGGALAIAGATYPAQVAERNGFVSVAVTSPLALNGSGAQGQRGVLRDDVGNEYQFYHGSGTNPPRVSRWDFVGPLDPRASRLTFSIAGYGLLEGGDHQLTIALP